jgi:lipopolysaccharide transport system ATP-binding protein
VLNFRIHIWTIDGIHVMAIGSDAEPRHRGLVKCAVKIPPNLLNDTIYNVSLQIVKDAASTLYMHLDILVFEVSDTVRIGNWFGKWPGVIRPSFEWHTEDIESNGA